MADIRYRVWAGNDAQGRRRPDKWLTEAELLKRWDYARLHPEYRRRMLTLFVLSGHRIGFLSGARSHAQQVTLYAQRGGVGVAPPGISWHEDDAYEDLGETWALAADLIEDATTPANELDLVDSLGPLVGLHDFSDVNREDWHVQPDEMPNSRSAYKKNPAKYRLTVWSLPGDKPVLPVETQPSTPPVEDDMHITIFSVRDCLAVFIAETTSAGVALNVRWTGPGSPHVESMLAAHRAAGAKDVTIDVADLANTFLLGPVPVGDNRVWTYADFAG